MKRYLLESLVFGFDKHRVKFVTKIQLFPTKWTGSSQGELSCNGHEIHVFNFLTQKSTKHTAVYNTPRQFGMSGHGGADYCLMHAFISAVAVSAHSSFLFFKYLILDKICCCCVLLPLEIICIFLIPVMQDLRDACVVFMCICSLMANFCVHISLYACRTMIHQWYGLVLWRHCRVIC